MAGDSVMLSYYSVQRSEKYLAHYGVKGMKWGVHKALESNNERKLDRQYQKAQKKLEKLNLKADKDIQKIYAKKHAKRAGIALGVSAAGIGAGIAHQKDVKNKINKLLIENPKLAAQISSSALSAYGITKPNHKVVVQRKKKIVNNGKGVKKVGEGLGIGQVGTEGLVGYKHPSAYPNQPITNTPGIGGTLYTHLYDNNSVTLKPKHSIYTTRKRAAELVTLAGLGAAAYQTGKAIAAKWRTTDKGHAKAVAKRDAWQKEMQAAFKGTKYGKKRSRH